MISDEIGEKIGVLVKEHGWTLFTVPESSVDVVKSYIEYKKWYYKCLEVETSSS